MMMMRSTATAIAALLLATGTAAAQACLGLPTRDGQIAVSLTYAPLDDGNELGGEFLADVSGPTTLGFGYRSVADSGRETFFGHVAYDFFLVDPDVCAVAGVEFTRDPLPGTEERLAVPVGLGIGKTLRSAVVSTTVYALPRYAWVREVPLDGGDAETSHEFLGEAGVTLGLFPFHLGGAVILSSLSGDEPEFRIRAGIRF